MRLSGVIEEVILALHQGLVKVQKPGDASKACQAGRFPGSGGRITRGQTPVAYHEAFAATCSESDVMGSADARILCAFRVTRTLEQDGRDTEGFRRWAVNMNISRMKANFSGK